MAQKNSPVFPASFLRNALVATVALAASLTMLGGQQSAADENQPLTAEALARLQAPLQAGHDRVAALVAMHPEWEGHFSGIEILVRDESVNVYLTKDSPEEFVAAIRDLSQGVTFRILQGDHSREDMRTAALEVMRTTQASSVQISENGSGIVATFTPDDLRDASPSAASNPMLSRAGVPVDVRIGEPPVPAGGTRQLPTPTSGWDPGARIDTGGCSTGFGVRDSSGNAHLLTAAHCYENGQVLRAGRGTLGTTHGRNPGRDIIRIDVDSVSPYVQDGPWNGPRDVRKIIGASSNPTGSYVCTSGSWTGVNCNLLVTASTSWIWMNNRLVEVVAAEVSNISPTGIAVGKGDSGGPVFGYLPHPTDRIARGIISALSDKVPCPSTTASTECGTTVHFIDITRALEGGDLIHG